MNIPVRSDYLRHIGTLLSGSVLAQLILLAATPVLTRLYSPADFGIFALFLSVVTIVGMVASGRYEVAILLPRSDWDAGQLARYSLLIALGVSFLAFFLSLLPLGDWWQGLQAYRLLLAPAIFLQAAWQVMSVGANRQRKYRLMTRSRILGAIGISAISIALGYAEWASLGLILGKMAGQIVEVLSLLAGQSGWLAKKEKDGEAAASGRAVLRRYRSFLRFSTIEALLNAFFRQIPIFALSGFFSAAGAGFYSLANKLVGNPSSMVASAVGQVFFQRAVEKDQEGGDALRRFFLENMWVLFWLALPGSVVIILFGPSLFAWALGPEWQEAGLYAAWLMPFLAVSFIKAPLSCVFDIRNKIRENLVFELLFVLISLLAFWVGLENESALLGVQFFSLGNAVVGLLQLGWFYRITKLEKGRKTQEA